MRTSNIPTEIDNALREEVGVSEIKSMRRVGGGCINDTRIIETDQGNFFVKINLEGEKSMFETERLSLKLMYETNSIRVPQPFYIGTFESGGSFFIMEKLDLNPPVSNSHKLLGNRLAKLHVTSPPEDVTGFGFPVDNYIGDTPQINTPYISDWISFFTDKRLRYQLQLAEENGFDLWNLGKPLINKVPSLFEGMSSESLNRRSLIHGDLWGGNWSALSDGEPVLYDPASYYAQAEAEFGIMVMFGGFNRSVFDEYHKILPQEPGFDKRVQMYELYHTLNHLNIFGGGYLGSAKSIMKSLVN
eukprot:gb/GECH01001214.1/.p1 GENE.gb/GECH01001214.1/~~gb/GECH01001214.1/.p1  ORF type:complete len:302 (+),score=73.12 gb/GECH01001214.1/:1-906(+)